MIDKGEMFREVGLIAGYPICCVETFIEEVKDLSKLSPERSFRKLTGTGYVPCLKCNRKSEEELIEIINKNRKIKSEFPNGDQELVEFINKNY